MNAEFRHALDRVSMVIAALLAVTVVACARSDELRAFDLQFPLADHPVYDYLERMQTAGRTPLLSSMRPWLGHLHHPVSFGGNAGLDAEDRRYLSESAAAMQVIGFDRHAKTESGWTKLRHWSGLRDKQALWLYRSGFHFASWSYDTTFAVAIQPVYGLEIIETGDTRGTITRLTSGARFEGGYARRLRFLVDFRDHTESGNGPYLTRDRLYEDRWAAVDLKGQSSTSYDISESCLQYYGRDLSLAAGRGRFRWGPARHGSLFLNAGMPPFDYVRFDAVLESAAAQAVYYTFLHGSLESQIAGDSLYQASGGRWRTLNAQKYFSSQRLEVRPRANLLVAFSQGVIYGDRGVQLGYLTPLNFLYSVQHSNDDKDNTVIAFDVNWRPVPGVRVYGETFFDDIVVSDLTTSSASNKSAYTAGVHLAGTQGGIRHLDGGVEYTKIRPFVYSHVFAVNAYTHWTSPLGYTLEPNSEFFTVDVRATIHPVQIALRVSRQNHGSDGGDIGRPLEDPEKGRLYPFLGGTFSRTTRVGGSLEWEVLPNLWLRAAGTHVTESRRDSRTEWHGGFGWNL